MALDTEQKDRRGSGSDFAEADEGYGSTPADEVPAGVAESPADKSRLRTTSRSACDRGAASIRSLDVGAFFDRA